MPSWTEITTFATQYDCHALIPGGLPRVMALADRVKATHARAGVWEGTVTELQACLNFEVRSWQNCNMEPDGEDRTYINALYTSLTA